VCAVSLDAGPSTASLKAGSLTVRLVGIGRYALRMVPLTKTAKANMADLETLAKELLAQHFHQPGQLPRTVHLWQPPRSCS